MNSKRIIAIASLVDANALVIDIGTDHAYLPIYLIQNNITTTVDASDISKEVLKQSKENINKYHLNDRINLFVSDGFKNLNKKYDIAVICGMGTKTILDILDDNNIPNTLIIQSNHDIPLLREQMNRKGYIIDKELYITDNNKDYVIFKFIKGDEILSNDEIEFGKYPNIEYLRNELEKNTKNFCKNNNRFLNDKINRLKEVIEKIQD